MLVRGRGAGLRRLPAPPAHCAIERARVNRAERNEDGLTERQALFVDWLVTPEWERDPKTQKEWALLNGVAQETPSHWKREERVRRAIEKRADDVNLSPERIQDIINAVYRAAQAGDMKAAQLYLQHADKLKPKRIVIEDSRLADMSDEELARELEALGLT